MKSFTLKTGIAAALLTTALFGCTQHATAPTAARPADMTSSNDLNTFGDSKEQAAADAERARDRNYSADKDAAPDAPAPNGRAN